jgi:hypothetical protein
LIVLLAFSQIVTPSFSKDKNRDWQTGRLVSIEEGVPETSPGMILRGNPPLVVQAKYRVWIYTLETEAMSYGFSARSKSPRPLTINSQVKFALEPNGKAFLLDEGGKEFKASLVKKATKQPAH